MKTLISNKDPEFIGSQRLFGGPSGQPSLASINDLGNCSDMTFLLLHI